MSTPGLVLTLTAADCRCVRVSPDGTAVLTAGSDGVRYYG